MGVILSSRKVADVPSYRRAETGEGEDEKEKDKADVT